VPDDRLEFRVLGPLEVRADGVAVRVGGPKQRALLAMLVLSANRVVSRERLVDELADDQPAEAADRTLAVQVSRLRKALGSGGGESRLVARAPGYVLRVDAGELDLWIFERALADGRRALEEGDPERAADLLREGLSLWRGRPLADLEFEPFARVEVERLEELRLSAVEERVDAELALGRHAAVVAELEALVAEHPLRERVRGQLMLALYRCGRQADALEAYRKGRSLLANELALDPSPRLRALEQAILRQDRELDQPGAAAGAVAVSEVAERAEPAELPEPTKPERRPRRSQRRRFGVAAGLVALGIGLGLGLGFGGSTEGATVRGDAVALVSPRGGGPTAVVPLTAAPSGLAVGFGSLWVSQYGNDAVTRIDLRTRSVRQTIQVGNGPIGIVATAGDVWVGNTLSNTVSRIDPSADTVVQTIPVGHQPSALAAARGSVWVANRGDGNVWRLDPRTGRKVSMVETGIGSNGLAIAGDTLWVSNDEIGTVTRVDARTGTVDDTIHVGDAPTALVVDKRSVWVLDRLDASLTRVDPATDTVASTIPVGGNPSGLAMVDGAVWLTNASTGALARVDEHRLAVKPATLLGERPSALATSPAGLWVAVDAGGRTHRGGTLRVLSAISGVPAIDPAAAQALSPVQLLGLTNDGLVTLDHVGGPEGARLVPDLALSLPAPGNGGLDYTFRLRPGISYSTGGEVRPTDVLHSFERLFDLRSPGISFYEQIVGTASCERETHCNLSTGIVADDRDLTVTFHLAHPDSDFLYKLAQSYAFVLPATTPDHPTSKPLPATGPYVIAAYAPGRLLRFVRNPRFHEWSAAAQPDGYPDRIDWNLKPTPAQSVSMVEHGQADLMSNQGAPPRAQRTQLSLHFPSQLRVNWQMGINFWALNTRTRPFNDIRVRRALNYAINRSTIVNIYGGANNAQPTCQILPPQIPGFQRYCPYTTNPGPDGRWRGPNLRLARALVAESGTKGMAVTVWDAPDPPATVAEAHYLVSVLRSLGYRASARFLSDRTIFQYTNDSRNHAQIITGGWTADYPSASDFIGKLTCANFTPGNGNATNDSSELCKPALDRQIARAESLQATDPSAATAAWARLDRKLTNLAIWLPTITNKNTDIVSTRVGNYQYQALWGPMYDQIWVR
jgi:YVTN family beta-propeller protein